MVRGRLLAESLRLGHDLRVRDLVVTRIGRHDVSTSTAPDETTPNQRAVDSSGGAAEMQPTVWTFLDFEAPDADADQLARALADALVAENGWYADFLVAEDHVVVFAGRVFRYRLGDEAGRAAAVEYGLAAGTPPGQLDWGE